MTTESLYRFRCDAPRCTAVAIGEKISDVPDGWRILRSSDHIKGGSQPRGRRRVGLSLSERCIGEFRLELCVAHTDAFDDHRPVTEGRPGGRGRDSAVSVSCSCGASLGWAPSVIYLTGISEGPRHSGERLWWKHLPADLQWYAQREQEVDRA